MHEERVKTMIELLGLQECKDTIVGNDLLRGVSGGQKKRVSIGEMIIGNARGLFLDEITTGMSYAPLLPCCLSSSSFCSTGRESR